MNPQEQKKLPELQSTPDQTVEVSPVSSPEQEYSPEMQVETMQDEQPASLDQKIEGLVSNLKNAKQKKSKGVVPVVRDDMTLQIETIMSDGLDDAFAELTPVQQQEFKIKGEAAAQEIRQLLGAARVKVKKIFGILVDWLKMLPGINRYYLIQEAKIKTDQIMSLKLQDY